MIATQIITKIAISRAKLAIGAPSIEVRKNVITNSPKCFPKTKNNNKSKQSAKI